MLRDGLGSDVLSGGGNNMQTLPIFAKLTGRPCLVVGGGIVGRGVAELMDGATVAVPPMRAEELEQAIVAPVHRQGMEYEPGLVARLAADVADQPGALPLLQYALTRLFDEQVSGLIPVSDPVEEDPEAEVLALLPVSFIQRHRGMPLRIDGDDLVLKRHYDIAVAVDTPDGLVVPVIRDCDRKSLYELASDVVEASVKARDRKLQPADMQGGCFTISSLGGIGGTSFTPIVYAPQVAILGVSRAAMEPVWDGQEFQPRLRMPLSLSYDHRVVDGADGARFLRWICEALEQPLRLVMEDAS